MARKLLTTVRDADPLANFPLRLHVAPRCPAVAGSNGVVLFHRCTNKNIDFSYYLFVKICRISNVLLAYLLTITVIVEVCPRNNGHESRERTQVIQRYLNPAMQLIKKSTFICLLNHETIE